VEDAQQEAVTGLRHKHGVPVTTEPHVKSTTGCEAGGSRLLLVTMEEVSHRASRVMTTATNLYALFLLLPPKKWHGYAFGCVHRSVSLCVCGFVFV